MTVQGFSEIADKVAELEKIVEWLQQYMHVGVSIQPIKSQPAPQMIPQSNNRTRFLPDEEPSYSEKIRMAIREYGVATSDQIYGFFKENGWGIDSKKKNTLRGIFANMKKRGLITGTAADGFRFVDSDRLL